MKPDHLFRYLILTSHYPHQFYLIIFSTYILSMVETSVFGILFVAFLYCLLYEPFLTLLPQLLNFSTN